MISNHALHRCLPALVALLALAAGCGGGSAAGAQPEPEPPPPPPAGDTTAPVLAVTDPSATGSFTTTEDSITVAGTASDNVAVTEVSWNVNGGAEKDAVGLEDWSTPVISLETGDNTIRVTAADAAGNRTAAEIVVTRDDPPPPDGDTAAPVLAITDPSDTGSFTTTADSITVAGTASDNVAVTEVTWSVNGGAAEDAVGLENWSTSVILLEVGDNTVSVTAADAAGNSTAAEIVITRQEAPPAALGGIAIIGDSNSDEYRADDDRGGAWKSVTFNWMEQLVRHRGLNFGAWGTRAPPRRTGYAFNWALSGATAGSAISSGQHTGVAAQITAGQVSLVFIHIGFNDFARERYEEIYDGSISGAALDNKIAGVIEDITTAVEVVQAAGAEEVVLTDLFDYALASPQLVAEFPDPDRRQVVTDAIREVNAGLEAMAQQRGIVLVDLNAFSTGLLSEVDQNGFLDIGGELIDAVNPGNEPHHLRLDDSSQHAGTVGNSLFANAVFIDPVNAALGTSIPRFSEQEMLEIAGIAP